ncbi:MAG TPA: molybdopterin-dependent oxidoreductase [Candidatus Binatia bacterium]|jgi:sulfite dehydrogenase|nr:molybdopterin-dependent oxidoreductase [Candidatus Binatia bacterium]
MAPKEQRSVGLSRRRFLCAAARGGLGAFIAHPVASALAAAPVSMPFANGERRLVQFPQKRPLILLTMRPPQLETPMSVFNDGIFTPNDAFFVRYHLAQIPTEIDPDQFRLQIEGKVNSPLSLSLADLKTKFEPVEIAAVNQCSGNGRGFSAPRVAGGQMGNGAMGCARWKGVRLKDVLDRAGVAAGVRQVAFNGLDKPVDEKTPDFVKSLNVDHALDGEVMLAWQMNGEDLPMLNGFPLRLVVPGYYGTYWVKHVNEITVLDQDFAGFWMNTAYLIPDNAGACIEPGTTPKKTKPIARYNVRSFITSLTDGDKITVDGPLTVRGIAFDGGESIRSVLFSDDDGHTWREASLGQDHGKYAFREWTIPFLPARAGQFALRACATNRIGQSQPLEPLWNPSGYMRNVAETVRVTVT